ncbi:hypothetical protein [Agrobacterium sp. SORGH_AS 787]|uniref:hypothetical protein n=1 Tax=Agrobacterium sp. SORGH_AS 787 TaxID=3041775 RepID=UPI0032B70E9C
MELTFLLLMTSATTVIAQQQFVPPERQDEYTPVTSDLFLANACAKQLGWQDIYSHATNAFVTFAKQNNFPDAETLARTTATEMVEKVDGSLQDVSDESCAALSERVKATANR